MIVCFSPSKLYFTLIHRPCVQLLLHLPRVGLPAAIHFSEATPADDPMHTEVIHGQLKEEREETCESTVGVADKSINNDPEF